MKSTTIVQDKIQKLRLSRSLGDLASLLGYTPSGMSYILYKIPENEKYTEFNILKSNGQFRIIKAPQEKLKHLQSRVSELMEDCFEELFRNTLSHGFRKKYSIITNAQMHLKKQYVFNIDLKDFFPSINFGRVRGYFINDRNFSLNDRVATIIAQIVCHNNELPQGSPSSPIISNLIGHILDIHLLRLAKKTGCSYSRYADDITFSTNKKEFPKEIATREHHTWKPSLDLFKIIEFSGFEINPRKVSMQYRVNRQKVTGLVVNKKVNIPSAYYRKVRAMSDSLLKKGYFIIGNKRDFCEISQRSKITPIYGYIEQLRGMLSYIYHVKRSSGKKYSKGICKVIKKFICFEKFHRIERPLIICEGKTDVIHIKSALKNLANNFPKIVERREYDDFYWKLNFFNMSSSMLAVLHPGGVSGFNHIINTYKEVKIKTSDKDRKFPVIMLLDNDKEGEKMFSKNINNNKTKEKFLYLFDNVYFVLLPKLSNENSTTIETYFDEKTKKTVLEGKTFNPDSKFDSNKYYGKQVFAEKVIKPNWEKINFDNFKYLIYIIQEVIDDYKLRIYN